MHGDTILLMTFVLALVAALAGGLIARALRLPVIVGYLLGGIAVGPFTPGFIGDTHAMGQLAEVGVMFMMFGTGLHFSFKDLLEVKAIAVPGATLQIAAGTIAGCALAGALGWSPEAGVMLGLSVSIASTVVLIKNLADAGLDRTAGGRVATGWLIVEDLATVAILVVLPVVFGSGEPSVGEVATGLAGAFAKTAVFVVLMLLVGSRALPWLLGRIARFCPRELFQLAVVVIALGTAMAAALLFDLSVALGAFLAGTVVGGSRLSHRVAAESIPFQDLFSIIFFASVGMMVNPAFLAAHLPELLALVLLVVAGKWLISMVIGLAFSAGARVSLTVAAGLSQIGEFSFLIGQAGVALGVLTADQYSLILGAAVVSIALNSFMFSLVGPLEEVFEARPRLMALYGRRADFVAAAGAERSEDAEPDAPARDARLALEDLFAAMPGFRLAWVRVSEGSVAAGSTLAGLDLRAKTGVQAVAMHRDDEVELSIEADMPLCVGDVLGLVGEPAQMETASELFR